MSIVINTDTTIATTVTAEEVKIVNNATLTVTGTLTCRKLIVEAGDAILEGSGTINVVEEMPKPSPIIIRMQEMMLMLMVMILAYYIIIILKSILFKKPVEKVVV